MPHSAKTPLARAELEARIAAVLQSRACSDAVETQLHGLASRHSVPKRAPVTAERLLRGGLHLTPAE